MTQQTDRSLPALCERLLGEFGAQVPPDAVVRCVDSARQAVQLFGEAPEEQWRVLERIVRADLQQLADGRDSSARVFGVTRRSRHSEGIA